jgi:hypothetical protein
MSVFRATKTVFYLLLFGLSMAALDASAAGGKRSRHGGGGYSGETESSISETAVAKSVQLSSQAQSQGETLATNSVGFGITAGGAVVRCAEGANLIPTDQTKGGLLIQSCLNSFEAANKMQALALGATQNGGFPNPNFGLDPDLIGSGKAHAVFSDLADNYGLSRGELARRMLEARGNPEILGDATLIEELFKGKLTRDQIVGSTLEADKLSKEEQDKLLAETRVAGLEDEFLYKLASAKSQAGKIARDLLKERADRSPSALSGAAVTNGRVTSRGSTGDTTHRFATERVMPLEDAFFKQESTEELQELSLFDVVSRKYREKTPSLLPKKH